MRIFITGGTGFVGKHAVEELQKGGHQPLLLSRRDPKKLFKSSRGLKFLRGDLADISRWKRQLASFKPQAALHMAWEGIPDYGPEMSVKNIDLSAELMRILGEIG